MADVIISRREALAKGLMFYFTGKPCQRGHICQRYVCSWGCCDCVSPGTRRGRPKQTREEHLAYMRQWYQDHRDSQIAKAAERYQANKDNWPRCSPEKNRAKVAAWQKANPDKVLARNTRWRKAHPDYMKAEYLRRSPSKKRGKVNGGYYTRAETNAILDAQGFLCANPLCRADLRTTKKHLDHKLSLKRGGTNDPANLQWLCCPCNLSKGTKTMAEWLGD